MGRKRTVIDEEDLPQDSQGADPAPGSDFPQELTEYLSTEQSESEYCVYLYRYSDENRSKWQICKFYNECPDSHAIGMKYGSGRFQLHAMGKDKAGKAWSKNFNFNLSEDYDRMRSQGSPAGGGGMQQIAQASQVSPADQIKPVIQLMREMTQVFLPLLQANNPINLMSGLNEAMVKNQVESFRQLSTLQRDLMGEYMSIKSQGDSDEESQEVVSDVEKIIEAVKMFIPQLTSKSTNPVASMVINQARKRPEFQRLVHDNRRLILAIRAMEKDEEIGRGRVDAILKRFGLKRPQ